MYIPAKLGGFTGVWMEGSRQGRKEKCGRSPPLRDKGGVPSQRCRETRDSRKTTKKGPTLPSCGMQLVPLPSILPCECGCMCGNTVLLEGQPSPLLSHSQCLGWTKEQETRPHCSLCSSYKTRRLWMVPVLKVILKRVLYLHWTACQEAGWQVPGGTEITLKKHLVQQKKGSLVCLQFCNSAVCYSIKNATGYNRKVNKKKKWTHWVITVKARM